VCELAFDGTNTTVAAVNTFGSTGLLSRKDIGVRDIWYQFDAEGNVAQRFDQYDTLLSTDLYDAWGNLKAGGDTTDPFGYKGQAGYYTDHETGLILCTLRYYDPLGGRWINRDPILVAGGVNLFGYCNENPVRFSDIIGLCPINFQYKRSHFIDPLGWVPRNNTPFANTTLNLGSGGSDLSQTWNPNAINDTGDVIHQSWDASQHSHNPIDNVEATMEFNAVVYTNGKEPDQAKVYADLTNRRQPMSKDTMNEMILIMINKCNRESGLQIDPSKYMLH